MKLKVAPEVKIGLAVLLCAQSLTEVAFAQDAASAQLNPAARYYQSNTGVAHVLELIRKCPSWLEIDLSDYTWASHFIEDLDEISHEPTESIREAEKIYVTSKADDNSHAWTKIFVLNNYLFNVPASTVVGTRKFYGGFAGVPFKKSSFDSLWPLRSDGHGHLTLVSQFRGFAGPDYQFLDEFDFFHVTYGRSALVDPHP